MGPKPFTPPKLTENDNIKPFSVPIAPSNDTNGTQEPHTPSGESVKIVETTPVEEHKSPISDTEPTLIKTDEEKNGKYDSSSLEEEANNSDSGLFLKYLLKFYYEAKIN